MNPSEQNEDQCYYVSTCGLSLACKLKPIYYGRQLKYDYNDKFNTVEHGDLVYVHCRDLVALVFNLNKFVKPICIVVNGDDNLFPHDYPQHVIDELTTNKKCVALFSQNNCLIDHPKFKHIPIGLDYHTLNWEKNNHLWGKTGQTAKQQEIILQACVKKMKPIQDTNPLDIITNFHLAMDNPPRRAALRKPIYDILTKIQPKWIRWLPEQTRMDFWLSCNNSSFVLCPPGNGYDTHRAWEVLCLGRIPIIQDLSINKVYEGLPVWIIKDWEEFAKLSDSQITSKFCEFVKDWNNYDWSRLSLKYWIDILNTTSKN